jgi:hypothetical protein
MRVSSATGESWNRRVARHDAHEQVAVMNRGDDLGGRTFREELRTVERRGDVVSTSASGIA